MDGEDALGTLQPLARALDYTRGKELVHCDVKPANTIIGPDSHVTLADFVVAWAAQATLSAGLVSSLRGDGSDSTAGLEQWLPG